MKMLNYIMAALLVAGVLLALMFNKNHDTDSTSQANTVSHSITEGTGSPRVASLAALDMIYKKWQVAEQQAASAPKNDFPKQIEKLTAIKREAEELAAADCAQTSKIDLLTGMQRKIDAYTAQINSDEHQADIEKGTSESEAAFTKLKIDLEVCKGRLV